jgi:predicted small metal-binding protein
MKTFTCKELGGICEEEISGASLDALAQAAGEHIREESDREHKALAQVLEESSLAKQKTWVLWLKKIWDSK